MKKLRSDCLIMTDKNGHKKSVRKMVIPLESASMISVPMCTCSIPMCCLKSKLVETCSAPLSSLTTNKRTIFRARRTASSACVGFAICGDAQSCSCHSQRNTLRPYLWGASGEEDSMREKAFALFFCRELESGGNPVCPFDSYAFRLANSLPWSCYTWCGWLQ